MNSSQTITFRIPFDVYNDFEIFCIENDLRMSDVIRESMRLYFTNLEVQSNDKITTYFGQGGSGQQYRLQGNIRL